VGRGGVLRSHSGVCRSDGARLRLIRSLRVWRRILWQNRPLRSYGWAGSTVTLKLKAADFRLRTRAHSLGSATQLAAKIFAAARSLLERETDGTKFRLLGVRRIMPIPAISSTTGQSRPSMRLTAFVPASATTRWSGGLP
jgi:hypothetical protein